jgi:small basic protein
MTPSAIIACLWVVASAIVAFLPMTRQYVSGIALLIAAPLIIIWLGSDYGWLFALVGVFGFGSMFRNPLIFIYRRLRGENFEVPK